jgi:uncharacterized repeat protein (TIGR03803 family)
MKLKSVVSLSLIALVTSFGLAAHSQTFSVLYTFNDSGEGFSPFAGVTLRGGALFGIASSHTPGNGLVFELQAAGNSWLYAPIYIFNSRTDGYNPTSRVVFGPDGHLYGTTQYGGQNNLGTVFQLTPPLSICKTAYCPWTKREVGNFPANYGISAPGWGDLIWDQQGNIYGATTAVGLNPGVGTYQLAPSGNAWTYTVFTRYTSGQNSPEGSGNIVLDKNGNVFGAVCCSSNNHGFIYEAENVGGIWQFNTIYTFSGGTDGGDPAGGLTSDSSGNLYGATLDGGTGGGGTFFELSPSGNTWTFQVLYNLPGTGYCGPQQSLTFDAAGNLYGTTSCNGFYHDGNVFKLTNTPNGWAYASLYDFKGMQDGRLPYSQVTIDTDGTLYGTTSAGGNLACNQGGGCGVVWQIKP